MMQILGEVYSLYAYSSYRCPLRFPNLLLLFFFKSLATGQRIEYYL